MGGHTPMIVSDRPLPCVVCEKIVMLQSATTAHPEAPEMVRAPDGVWLGFQKGDVQLEMIATCSPACLAILLSQ